MHLSECYRLLGLRMGASYDEIKSSYRRLARQYHPDVNPGEAQHAAQEKFIQLTEAYEKLLEVSQTPAMRQAQRLSRPSSSSQTRRTPSWESQTSSRQNGQRHSQSRPETNTTSQSQPPDRPQSSTQSQHKTPQPPQSPTPPHQDPGTVRPGAHVEAHPPIHPSTHPPIHRSDFSSSAQSDADRSRQRPATQPPTNTLEQRKKPTIQRDPTASQTDHQLKVSSYEQLQNLIQERRFPRAIALVEGLSQRLPNDREVRNWLAIAYYKWGCYLIGTGEPDKARLYLNKAIRTAPDYKELWYEVDRAMQRLDVDYL
jgi:tetratricopeptide (TPR) repeat protein